MDIKKSIKRTTIYLHPKLHKALRLKAFQVNVSVSDLINEAVQFSLKEDLLDLEAIEKRQNEPTRSFEDVVKDLKKDGLL